MKEIERKKNGYGEQKFVESVVVVFIHQSG